MCHLKTTKEKVVDRQINICQKNHNIMALIFMWVGQIYNFNRFQVKCLLPLDCRLLFPGSGSPMICPNLFFLLEDHDNISN